MLYQRSFEIEQRLERVLHLIEAGRYSTPALAATVGVSIPTISRIVAALRARGHEIRAERQSDRWRYFVVADRVPAKHRSGTKSQAVEAHP